MNEPPRAVFLSYASQDAEAARRICEALRASGIEVWFDQSELRGGDAWDLKIRQQIRDCALFIPIISAHTTSRPEGYFRLEWGIADQRTQKIARNKAFIIPVCVDGTPDSVPDLPESFLRVQWTRLAAGATPPSFCQRIATLLGASEPAAAQAGTRPTPPVATSVAPPVATPPNLSRWILVVAALLLVGGAIALKPWRLIAARPGADFGVNSGAAALLVSEGAVGAAPERSIAVLPFTDMSEKKDQEYFSDGLSEELIDLLTKIPELRVPARTSSFYFKGKSEDIPTIARRLMVAHVLEGSVRKSGMYLRITAQLVRADNGYHLWSQTYDRKLDDIFKVQDEIAGAVVSALKVSLADSSTLKVTTPKNTEAYTLYLQGRAINRNASNKAQFDSAAEYLRRAIKADPTFAKAWAWLANVLANEVALVDVRADAVGAEMRGTTGRALAIPPTLPG